MDPRSLTDIIADFLGTEDAVQHSTLTHEFNQVAPEASSEEKYNVMIEFIAASSADAFPGKTSLEVCEHVDKVMTHLANSKFLDDRMRMASTMIEQSLQGYTNLDNARINAARLLCTLYKENVPRFLN